MQEGKLNPNEGKLKALQAAMAKIEKDFGKGSIMKLGDEHVENAGWRRCLHIGLSSSGNA